MDREKHIIVANKLIDVMQEHFGQDQGGHLLSAAMLATSLIAASDDPEVAFNHVMTLIRELLNFASKLPEGHHNDNGV